MKKFKGSHGTSKTRAIAIGTKGFEYGSGRVGKGIYFWKESELFIDLARHWWECQRKRGKYDKDHDTRCAIILVKVKARDSEVLDLETEYFKNMLIRLQSEKKIDINEPYMEEKIHSLFIEKLEKKFGVEYKIILCRVSPPADYKKWYPIGIAGAPIAIIVRNNDCLSIEKTIN